MFSFASFFGSVWPYLIAILLFLLMIVIHEFGHFIFAKMLGVRVNEFAIGFGPTIFKKQGKETLYSLKLIPFGGYCAMEGEDEGSNDPKAFCNKKPWRRFLIVIAGALFNIIFGFVLLVTYLSTSLSGSLIGTTTVHSFDKNAVSCQSGLQAGDTILRVDGRSCITETELGYAFSAVEDEYVDLVVERDGEEIELKNVRFEIEEEKGIKYFKRDFWLVGEEKTVGGVIVAAGKYTVSYSRTVLFSLVDLISGKFSLNEVSGPVGVASALGEATTMGLSVLLPMLCLITINLGVFNLLPIPALDGGRLIFILFEMIFRKPVPQKYESVVHAAGFILLMLFAAFITLKDVIGLF